MDDKVDNHVDIKNARKMKNARRGLERLLTELETPNPVLQEAFLVLFKEYERYNKVGALEILDKYSRLVCEWEKKGYLS